MIYEMLCGLPPFYDEDDHVGYQKMVSSMLTMELEFPSHVSPEARGLLHGLLQTDPKKRLGGSPSLLNERSHDGVTLIKMDPFFAAVDFTKVPLLPCDASPLLEREGSSPLSQAKARVEDGRLAVFNPPPHYTASHPRSRMSPPPRVRMVD